MTYPDHAKATLALGLPLVGGHLAQFAIGLTDTAMLGWYGIAELAAVTLASGSYFLVFFLLGAGFAFAVMPLVAAAAATRDEVSIRRCTRMGLWLSVLFAAVAMPVMWWSQPILLALGQTEELAGMVAQYLQIAGWALFPALLVMVMKSYLAALERTQAVLWITVLAALINAVANYALIFGHWGAPELGIRGAAIASLATHSASLVAVIIYAVRALPHHNLFQRMWRPDWEMFARVFALGLPIGLTTLGEVSMFAASSMMMGWIGTIPLAAHGIVLSITGAAFMVHLGLSNAATIRAGSAYGQTDRELMRRGALVVTALSLCVSLITIAVFLSASVPLLSLFMDNDAPARPEILEIGVGFLAIAALFQLVDGGQAIAIGLLRGVQDTRVPMAVAGLSYWALGIPTSYLLGFVFGWGGTGVWLGLVIGLGCAGVFLTLRFWRRGLNRMAVMR